MKTLNKSCGLFSTINTFKPCGRPAVVIDNVTGVAVCASCVPRMAHRSVEHRQYLVWKPQQMVLPLEFETRV